ncbi:MAG: GGDEF domain-containing protein [Aquificaceae bacterium]|nr:GGDEF domain-containing protein [Aquificaceae bacterium]
MSYIVLILIYFYNYKLIRIQRKFLRKEYIDPLTGLYNRHFLQEIAKPELRATEELSRGYVVFFMDVDNLKDINDTKGHYMGDMLLSIVGETIRKTLRKGLDIAIRYGGDEFLLIAPIKVCSEALTIVHRLEASFDSIDGAQEIKPSVSIGFACFPEDGKDLDELIRIADQRMYSIKRKKKTSGDFHKG